jgi:hypothetical protein
VLGPAAANREFYVAFTAHDADAMDRVWAEQQAVVCVHPGKPAIVGRGAVMQSWREILSVPGATPTMEAPRLVRLTERVAIVVCVERLGRIAYVATNVFHAEDGQWRMVSHHAGPTQIDAAV